MTKYTFILSLLFLSIKLAAQNNCKLDTLTHYNHINFDDYTYQKIDTTIRNINFNCFYQCPITKTTIFGNRSLFGSKKGHWRIQKSNGQFILSGEFKRNKKHGAWYLPGHCRQIYRKGKQSGFVCPNFSLKNYR